MNKKLFVIPALLVAIGGGAAFAQSDIFAKAATISNEQAKEIALKQLNGKIVDFEYDHDGLTPHYEIEIATDTEKEEYRIDAHTGELTLTDRETYQLVPTTKTSEMNKEKIQPQLEEISISQQKAIEIAQSKAAGNVTNTEIDFKNGNPIYEIEIRNGKTEYDFEIDASTGAVLKYEEDLED